MNKQDKTIKDLKERNDKLSNQCLLSQARENATQRKNKELQERIDKAIEYTEKHIGIRIGDNFIPTNKELLDILKGEDND